MEHLPNEIRFNKHPKRKNNDLVAAMYALYSMGKSLEDVGLVYSRTRQSIYQIFKRRGYPLRSKKLAGLTVIDGIRFTLMKGGYLRGTVPGKGRISAQRYVWEKVNGPVPAGYCLCFINENRTDVSIGNLALIALVEVANIFNPMHFNQFTAPRRRALA